MSYVDVARKMVDDGVNVLIDLAGHTRGGSPEVLALRPAPVQAHWLGFSSTTGAAYIDYLITDRIQLPPEDQQYCSEKLVYLPHTFMAASRPPVAVETFTQAAFETFPSRRPFISDIKTSRKSFRRCKPSLQG